MTDVLYGLSFHPRGARRSLYITSHESFYSLSTAWNRIAQSRGFATRTVFVTSFHVVDNVVPFISLCL